MTLTPERFCVAVIMQRTPLANRWISERWEPVAVEPSCVQQRIVTPMRYDDIAQWRFDGFMIDLHRTEAEGYHLNLVAPDPAVFVMWRMLEPEALVPDGPLAAPFLVTVSYNQAARMMDGGEQVDRVPMPADIRAWLEPFTQTHYKPEPRRKIRRRDPLATEDNGNVPQSEKLR